MIGKKKKKIYLNAAPTDPIKSWTAFGFTKEAHAGNKRMHSIVWPAGTAKRELKTET